jgi:uncharacterized phage protein gp47/JayE
MISQKKANEIADEIIAQMATSLNTTIPLLPKSFCRVLAKALGGVFVLLYEFAGWNLLQMFVKTASNKPVNFNGKTINPLQAHGELVGIYQKTGQRAERTVEITVLTQGGTIVSGERIANPDTQMIYVVVGNVTLNAPTVYATIRATRPGVLGNVDLGTELYFVSPPDAVEKEVTVSTDGIAGVDPETTEAYRERVLERWLARPQGGAMADYKNWAEEVTGVRNAYPYAAWEHPGIPNSRAGQVFVFIESDDTPDGEPLPAELANDVKDHIEGDGGGLSNRRNINAEVRVFGITRTAFDVTISQITTGSPEITEAAKTAIQNGLTEFFYDREPSGQVGYTVLPPKKDVVSQMEVGGIVSRIAAGYNGSIGSISISTGGVDVEVYPLQEGEKAKLGTLTWN